MSHPHDPRRPDDAARGAHGSGSPAPGWDAGAAPGGAVQPWSGGVRPGQGYPGEGYPSQGHQDQGYPSQGHHDQGYPSQGHHDQGYPGQGYPGQGYPGQVHQGQGGYPSEGHPGQGGHAGPPGPPLGYKDTTVAYLLWFFLAQVGAHKFYLRQPLQGVLYLGLTMLGWLTVWFFVGFLFFGTLFVLFVVDAFVIPERVRRVNADIHARAVHGQR